MRDGPRWRDITRILRRFTARRRSAAPNPRGTLAALREGIGEGIRWSADHHNHERAMPFDSVARGPEKVRVVRSRRDVDAVGAMLPVCGSH